MDLDAAIAASLRAECLLSLSEQKSLFDLARSVPPGGTIVELGSWMGGSTIMLAAGAMEKPDSRVYAVDLFGLTEENSLEYSSRVRGHGPDYFERFQRNLRQAGVHSRIEPIRGRTVAAAQQWQGPPIDLLFIDASHYYDDVVLDFVEWSVHCAEGATCAFHDYGQKGTPGIKRFVDRAIRHGLLKDVRFVDSIAYGTITTTDRRVINSRLRRRFAELFTMESDRESWYTFAKNHGWLSLVNHDRRGACLYALQAIRWQPARKEGWLLMACSVLNRTRKAEPQTR